VTNAAVRISNAVKIPSANIYIGGTPTDAFFVDGTYTGNADGTGKTANYPIPFGESIFAVWAGGDAGATATLSIIGIKTYGQ
jgi:hypothetical protein